MKKQPRHLMIRQRVSIKSMNLVQQLFFNEQATNNAAYDASFANSAKSMNIRDGQYRDTCIGDTYRAIILYRYRHRLIVSLQYRVSVSIKHVFMHRRYKCLDTVFEQDQSHQMLTARSFKISEECEMKLNSLVDSKRRIVHKFL